MIVRERYLKRIRPFYGPGMVKVITGVRRCGKSVLLEQVASELAEAGAGPVFLVDLDDYDNRPLKDPDALHAFAKERIAGDGAVTHFLFDEIQDVPDFELVVNSLNSRPDVSVFITGSNSKLLSGELATKLGGRTLSFRVMPFGFGEFLEFLGADAALDAERLLPRYLEWGGFPLVCGREDDESRRVVLDSLYSSIVLRDIIQRNGIASARTLENVLDYLIANTSCTLSGNSVARALTDSARKVSAPTVYDLVRCIEESYVVSKAERWDVRGKKALAFEAKEYACDLGLFRIRRSPAVSDMGRVVETAVYNELIARGLRVYVGKTGSSEVDFVAMDGERLCYIQATYLMADAATADREFGSLAAIRDDRPKYVVSMDPVRAPRDGIAHLGLAEFLLNEGLLRLA